MPLKCDFFCAKVRVVDKNELAQKIRALRKTARMTQEELAARAGVDRRSLQRIESAEGSPNMATLLALGNALNTEFGPVEESIVPEPLPQWAADISGRLQAIEKKMSPNSIPPSLWAAWQGAEKEKWRQQVAMFFLTGDPAFLDHDVPDELQRRLQSGLRFYQMTPAPKTRAPRK